MKIEQKKWTKKSGWQDLSDNGLKNKAQLVFVFGGTSIVKDKNIFGSIKSKYPKSHIVSCSTAGEIIGSNVMDDSIALTAVYFESTKLEFSTANIMKAENSKSAGIKLASKMPQKNLKHCMVFSDGLKVNGTSLVSGLIEKLPTNVAVTGGLVGDGTAFKETYVGLDKTPEQGNIVLIGFYGNSLKIGYGSLGGWDPFGPERKITKSKNNILFELDGQPALKLYKSYLGDKAKGLPSTGLLFPLSLRVKTENKEVELVRTILGVDEKEQSMTFAGDMPEGAYAKLMKANFERLIDGAGGAATMTREPLGKSTPDLAILISCIGRKLVLKERVEEEVEAVKDVLGGSAFITGFYSYGEISPVAATDKQCQLHNQTMTITTFREG